MRYHEFSSPKVFKHSFLQVIHGNRGETNKLKLLKKDYKFRFREKVPERNVHIRENVPERDFFVGSLFLTVFLGIFPDIKLQSGINSLTSRKKLLNFEF